MIMCKLLQIISVETGRGQKKIFDTNPVGGKKGM